MMKNLLASAVMIAASLSASASTIKVWEGKTELKGWSDNVTVAASGFTDANFLSIYIPSATSAITEIEAADENIPVEYFNLQGIRVANPENGLYIRRQGNKVSKVLVK